LSTFRQPLLPSLERYAPGIAAADSNAVFRPTRGDRRGDRRPDYRRDQLPVVNTRGDCRSNDRRDDCRNRTGDRSSNPFAYLRRYANDINQKISLISGA